MLNKSLLLIDDEASVREVIQACLSDLGGWNVLTVASAREGLKYLTTEKRPDAILVDVLMPDMDGISFIQSLHQIESVGLAPPVILLTVKARWFSVRELRELGAVTAIAKPFNPVTLPDEIARALGWDLSAENGRLRMK